MGSTDVKGIESYVLERASQEEVDELLGLNEFDYRRRVFDLWREWNTSNR